MRRTNRTVLGALFALSLLMAPPALAENSASDPWSLVDWVQDVLDDLLGADLPEDDTGDGLPNAGPFPDPAG